MCLQVFVAADEPLPLVDFDAATPAFNAVSLHAAAEPVLKYFSKPHVRSVGAHTGCSCGFRYNPDDLTPDFLADPEVPDDVKDMVRADYADCHDSVRQLRRFLADLVSRGGSVEVFSCWSGAEDAEPTSRRTVTANYFGSEIFRFVEGELLTVVQG